jgi:hypothetical protein
MIARIFSMRPIFCCNHNLYNQPFFLNALKLILLHSEDIRSFLIEIFHELLYLRKLFLGPCSFYLLVEYENYLY